MANKERLYQVLDAIKANPNHWNQEDWHCGTSHCFAGFAQLIKHAIPISSDVKDADYTGSGEVEYLVGDKELTDPLYEAEKWLELNHYQSKELFSVGNTLEDLENLIIEFVGER